jgi:hypothetical protein
MAVGRHPEETADDRDRVRLGEVVKKIEAAALEAGIEKLLRKRLRRSAHRLDGSGREGRRDQLADSRVLGRFDEEQAPALNAPECLPARIERLGVELALAADVAEVAAEPPVTQAAADVRVTGDEVAAEVLVEVDGVGLAQGAECRIGIGDERRVGGVEGEGGNGDPRKLDAAQARITTRLQGSSVLRARVAQLATLDGVIVEPFDLRTVVRRACRDAAIDPDTVVVWIVDASRPPGSTPIAYLHPAGKVRDDTVLVFRSIGAERARASEGLAHRVAVWRQLPDLPATALGPMLRHELAHAVRWEQSGSAFYEADERLRAAVDGSAYAQLPTEREANAAAAAYARHALSRLELAELELVPDLSDLLAAEPPADVVGETLALLGEEVDVAPAGLERRPDGLVVELVAPVPAVRSAGMR